MLTWNKITIVPNFYYLQLYHSNKFNTKYSVITYKIKSMKLFLMYQLDFQVQQGTGPTPTSSLQGVSVSVGQQGMFMAQSGVGVTGGRPTGFPVGGVGSSALQGPLAFLEKTTSNIGMPERRS